MQNIQTTHIRATLKNYSERRKIDVLLATYNGQSYLGEFLNSLKNQVGVQIVLHVSDDGSTDQTLKVLNDFLTHFDEYYFYQNCQLGARDNFAFLLSKSKSDYVAFADQDDIWLPDHLQRSIKRIENFDSDPAGTFCDVIEFNHDSKSNRNWPNLKNPQSHLLFFENTVRGCTLVINAQARTLIEFSEKAIMHDWWIALILRYTGTLTYSSNPEVLYRLHENNLVGAQKSLVTRLKRFYKSSKQGIWPPASQLAEFISLYSKKITPERTVIFRKIERIMQKSPLQRKLAITFCPLRFRRSIPEEVLLRISLLFREV